MRAIQVLEFGGPEVLRPADVPEPRVGEGQILVHVDRAGVNYADTHQAENTYLSRSTVPMVPGGEVVGRTDDGRRVVALVDGGGYAERAAALESQSFEVPDGVDDVSALALIVQGATAWLLLRRTARIEAGETVVVHAGAGGVGSLAVQLAKALGARNVIATASTPEKRELALSLGADVAIDANTPDLVAALRSANGGRRVDVVLDMTGGSITDQSVAALAPFGRLAFYGMASRQAPAPIAPTSLLAHSTTVGGMWLPHAFTVPGLMPRVMTELFGLVEDGSLRVIAGGEYPLSQARRAHEDLRARRTTGKLVLDPSL
ncbi:quinone oxidoreductase family protein [Microbacterium rhizomatis]|uniref:NADPH:quinone oxidoreductase family protein n=1 Tax=Microbacterium rhizomatis TaxID=1631477 RepID=A0A5J5J2J6_9MICO|nr:NADPH:quinone oxidoreductase family protein [Microbacterium rhizomatis]KAA9110291.1 NADPH:quinone oxidoreductase family protein [Microbacterium rhizomatis]